MLTEVKVNDVFQTARFNSSSQKAKMGLIRREGTYKRAIHQTLERGVPVEFIWL